MSVDAAQFWFRLGTAKQRDLQSTGKDKDSRDECAFPEEQHMPSVHVD